MVFMKDSKVRTTKYQADSMTLIGAVSLGTGVMIGAGIFALTGQMAEMTGTLFPLGIISAALIVSFSAYSYVKMSNAYPSARGRKSNQKLAGGKNVSWNLRTRLGMDNPRSVHSCNLDHYGNDKSEESISSE